MRLHHPKSIDDRSSTPRWNRGFELAFRAVAAFGVCLTPPSAVAASGGLGIDVLGAVGGGEVGWRDLQKNWTFKQRPADVCGVAGDRRCAAGDCDPWFVGVADVSIGPVAFQADGHFPSGCSGGGDRDQGSMAAGNHQPATGVAHAVDAAVVARDVRLSRQASRPILAKETAGAGDSSDQPS